MHLDCFYFICLHWRLRVGPYIFQAENWSSLPHRVHAVVHDLAFENSDADSTEKTVFIQIQVLQCGKGEGIFSLFT